MDLQNFLDRDDIEDTTVLDNDGVVPVVTREMKGIKIGNLTN